MKVTRKCIEKQRKKIMITENEFSLVNIEYNPKKIDRKCFMVLFCTIKCGEQHTKSLPKSDLRKGSKCGVKKDGRQCIKKDQKFPLIKA